MNLTPKVKILFLIYMFHIENSQLSKFFVINLTLQELKFYRSFLGLRFTAKNLESCEFSAI